MARVDAERVDAEAGDAALDEELGRVGGEARERRLGVAEVAAGIWPVCVPAGVDEHRAARLDRAVALLELPNRGGADRRRRVTVDPGADVELHGGTDELRDLDGIDTRAVAVEMRGRVEVGAGVLRNLELAGVAAVGVVLGDGRRRERARARPEHRLRPERLGQVDEGGERAAGRVRSSR